MAKKPRTSVVLSGSTRDRLEQISQITGESVSNLIRRAVELYLEPPRISMSVSDPEVYTIATEISREQNISVPDAIRVAVVAYRSKGGASGSLRELIEAINACPAEVQAELIQKGIDAVRSGQRFLF